MRACSTSGERLRCSSNNAFRPSRYRVTQFDIAEPPLDAGGPLVIKLFATFAISTAALTGRAPDLFANTSMNTERSLLTTLQHLFLSIKNRRKRRHQSSALIRLRTRSSRIIEYLVWRVEAAPAPAARARCTSADSAPPPLPSAAHRAHPLNIPSRSPLRMGEFEGNKSCAVPLVLLPSIKCFAWF
ncbi:hypothetical protein EVAR_37340_1 [Eumeta japonica]|uniref:Uncharacterized protein n=1 Tax=Eumeta variegata TaxID=151549 RepID=A0A4C1X1S9_EUMVA|nr:hypothetical protein EVAR_37340_1 [Eumeta japonica]